MGYLNASKLFGKAASADIEGMAVMLFGENTQSSRELGKPLGLVYHHTAGTYNQCYNGYHFNVVFNQKKGVAHVVKNLSLKQLGQHLWGRNTGMIGISFSAMRGAVNMTNHAGPYPITAEMIKVGARLGAELCAQLQLNPAGSIETSRRQVQADSLIVLPGQMIRVPVISDHATYARYDGYYPSRWDVGGMEGPTMQQIMQELSTHYSRLKAGKDKFEYLSLVKE